MRRIDDNLPAIRRRVPDDVEEEIRLLAEVIKHEDNWASAPLLNRVYDLGQLGFNNFKHVNWNSPHESNLSSRHRCNKIFSGMG